MDPHWDPAEGYVKACESIYIRESEGQYPKMEEMDKVKD